MWGPITNSCRFFWRIISVVGGVVSNFGVNHLSDRSTQHKTLWIGFLVGAQLSYCFFIGWQIDNFESLLISLWSLHTVSNRDRAILQGVKKNTVAFWLHCLGGKWGIFWHIDWQFDRRVCWIYQMPCSVPCVHCKSRVPVCFPFVENLTSASFICVHLFLYPRASQFIAGCVSINLRPIRCPL